MCVDMCVDMCFEMWLGVKVLDAKDAEAKLLNAQDCESVVAAAEAEMQVGCSAAWGLRNIAVQHHISCHVPCLAA